MALEDDQTAWLQLAAAGKSKSKSKSINKQFEHDKRRRLKISAIFDGLPKSHSNYIVIDSQLKAAEKMAENGESKGAYNFLQSAKALA